MSPSCGGWRIVAALLPVVLEGNRGTESVYLSGGNAIVRGCLVPLVGLVCVTAADNSPLFIIKFMFLVLFCDSGFGGVREPLKQRC